MLIEKKIKKTKQTSQFPLLHFYIASFLKAKNPLNQITKAKNKYQIKFKKKHNVLVKVNITHTPTLSHESLDYCG